MDASELSIPAIVRLLGSCNASKRGRAVRLLAGWLPSATPAPSDADLLKLWKGLFYALWHADKPPVQFALASRLASILESLPQDLSLRYLGALLATLRREWPGIDFLRLDKFYSLIRRSFLSVFAFLRSHSWDLQLSTSVASVLLEKSLLSADKHQAQGVSYQIAEIFLDELKDFLPVPLEALDELLKPFLSVMEKSTDKILVKKVTTNVFERLRQSGAVFLDGEKKGESVEADSDVGKLGKIAFLLGFSKRFFELTSAPETLQANRKLLFGLHEGFLRLEKDLEKSKVNISAEDFLSGIGAEAGQPSNAEMEVGVEEKPSKKKRKKSMNASISESLEEVEVMKNVVADVKLVKKKKLKSKKPSDGVEKKKKRRNTITNEIDAAEPGCEVDHVATEESVNGEATDAHESIVFNESVISNLQKQFEKVAAESGMENGSASFSGSVATLDAKVVAKKRKRAKSLHRKPDAVSSIDQSGGSVGGKSGEKSAKKVRFSMKNNLVWKPHSPLPPESLRLPPSATPRGSALKKGVQPGPIKEISPTIKKVKLKKGRKSMSVSAAVKHLRKLQNLSA